MRASLKGHRRPRGAFASQSRSATLVICPFRCSNSNQGRLKATSKKRQVQSGELGCFDYRPDRRLPDRVRGESGPLGQTRLIRGQGLFIASATIWVLIPIPTQIAQARTARSFHKVSRSQRAIGSGKALRKDVQKWAIAQAANVRFGSLADIRERIRDVRFAPESGHIQRQDRCLLCAMRRHRRNTQPRRYRQPDAERSAMGHSSGLASCRASTLTASSLYPFAMPSKRRRSSYSEAKSAIRRSA